MINRLAYIVLLILLITSVTKAHKELRNVYMTEKLRKVLKNHDLWVKSNGLEGERANLEDKQLVRLNLVGVNLRGALLQMADFSRSNLSGANLANADLNGTNFTEANLYAANLTGAYIVSQTNFLGANLTSSSLDGSPLDLKLRKDERDKDLKAIVTAISIGTLTVCTICILFHLMMIIIKSDIKVDNKTGLYAIITAISIGSIIKSINKK